MNTDHENRVLKHRNDKINFTRESFARFKRDYAYAVAEGFESFIFEGHEVLTDYAKYMIAYIEGILWARGEDSP